MRTIATKSEVSVFQADWLIIPIHNSPNAPKFEGGKWPALYSKEKFLSSGRGNLTGETRILYLGNMAKV